MPSLASLLKAPQVDATAVLAAAEGADPTSQHARAIALLELDRFNEAFETFEKGGSSLQRAAPLAYAYSLYKTGRLQEARKVVEGVEDRGAKHLEAQVVCDVPAPEKSCCTEAFLSLSPWWACL